MKRLIHKPTINLGHNNPPVNLKSIDFTNSAIEKLKVDCIKKIKLMYAYTAYSFYYIGISFKLNF
jgi:hypothetical protein